MSSHSSDSDPPLDNPFLVKFVKAQLLPSPDCDLFDVLLQNSLSALLNPNKLDNKLTSEYERAITSFHQAQDTLARKLGREGMNLPRDVLTRVPRFRKAWPAQDQETATVLTRTVETNEFSYCDENWLLPRENRKKFPPKMKRVLRHSHKQSTLGPPQDDEHVTDAVETLKTALRGRISGKLELGPVAQSRLQKSAQQHRQHKQIAKTEPHEQQHISFKNRPDLSYLTAEFDPPLVPRPPTLALPKRPKQSTVKTAQMLFDQITPQQRVLTSPTGRGSLQERLNRAEGIEFEGVFAVGEEVEPRARAVWSSDGTTEVVQPKKAEPELPHFRRRSPPPSPMADPHKVAADSASDLNVHGVSSEGHERDLTSFAPAVEPIREASILSDAESVPCIDRILNKDVAVPDLPRPKASHPIAIPSITEKIKGLGKLSKELSWKPWKKVAGSSVADVAQVDHSPELIERVMSQQRQWQALVDAEKANDEYWIMRVEQLSLGEVRGMMDSWEDEMQDEMIAPTRDLAKEGARNVEQLTLARPTQKRTSSNSHPSQSRVKLDMSRTSDSQLPPSSPPPTSNPAPSSGRAQSGPRPEAVEQLGRGQVAVFRLAHMVQYHEPDEEIQRSSSEPEELQMLPSTGSDPQPQPDLAPQVERPKRAPPAEKRAAAGELNELLQKKLKRAPKPSQRTTGNVADIAPNFGFDFAELEKAVPDSDSLEYRPRAPPPPVVADEPPRQVLRLTPPYEELPFSRAKFELGVVEPTSDKVHRVVSTESLLKAEYLYMSLGARRSLHLVERPKRNNIEPQIIVDGTTCVFTRKLVLLPGKVKAKKVGDDAMESVLESLMGGFDRILIVLEQEVGPGARSSWTPPILTALRQLGDLIQSSLDGWPEVDIQVSFAAGPEGAADQIERFVHWCAHRAREEAEEDEDRFDGWADDREWLGEDETDAELTLLDGLPQLNFFSAALIASVYGSVQEFAFMDPQQRKADFGVVCGEARIEEVNQTIADMIAQEQAVQQEQERYSEQPMQQDSVEYDEYGQEMLQGEGDGDGWESSEGQSYGGGYAVDEYGNAYVQDESNVESDFGQDGFHQNYDGDGDPFEIDE